MDSRIHLAAGIGCAILTGCIFNNGETASSPLKAGVYHSDYGAAGRSQALESEIVLEADGRYHFFDIQDTTAWDIIKGVWESHDGVLVVKSGLQRFTQDGLLFGYWDSLPTDTSYLRGVSDDEFERLEVSHDSGLYYPVVRWVRYHRLEPAPIADGRYQYTESYSYPWDSTRSHSGMAYVSLKRNGAYEDGRFEDGRLLFTDQSPTWTQLGSFIIIPGAHEIDYDSLGVATDYQLDSNSEYFVRIRAPAPDSFQAWIPADQSLTRTDHWVTWRRTTSP
jgi:hypothetical protein